MKLSLPLRIFLFHLILMAGLGWLAVHLIRETFREYEEDWNRTLETLPATDLFNPMAREVARSLLLKLETDYPELQASLRRDVGQALDSILPTLGAVESLIILDREGRPQYINPPEEFELQVPFDDELAQFLQSEQTAEREVFGAEGERLTETVLPVIDVPEQGGAPRRLGAVLVRHRQQGAGTDGNATLVIGPFVREVARSMLVEGHRPVEETREERERYRQQVSEGLTRLLQPLNVESVVVADQELRIQYASKAEVIGLKFRKPEFIELFASDKPESQDITLQDNKPGKVVMVPVFEKQTDSEAGAEPTRLGSVLIRYRSDPGLADRYPQLQPPAVNAQTYLQDLIAFVVAAFAGGILLAAFSSLPVRRLQRALSDFQARGFRGGLDTKAYRLEKDLGSTVRAINELGGRLEALDAQGREREALLATLSQSLEEGMVALDPSDNPVAWNPAAVRLLTSPGRAAATDSEVSAQLAQAMDRNPDLKFAMESDASSATREIELRGADGTTVPVQATLVPFEHRPGEAGTLLLLRDLATLRKVEAHLLEAGRYAVLAHLAAGLAHEIRNPLHSIGLNATVIEQYVDTSKQDSSGKAVADALSTIRNETHRLAGLLNNYLGMVRPAKESGLVDVRELCRRVIQLVSYTARKSKVEISLEGQVYPPMVRGVADRLQQAILNLVLNAIQAMPGGGVLRLDISSSAGVVRLTVSDTGPGLPQDLSDTLFDTRVTTKPGGSGLGLPLVRMIAEAHGGSVWYRSAPGEGASFSLVLPAEQERASG